MIFTINISKAMLELLLDSWIGAFAQRHAHDAVDGARCWDEERGRERLRMRTNERPSRTLAIIQRRSYGICARFRSTYFFIIILYILLYLEQRKPVNQVPYKRVFGRETNESFVFSESWLC